MDVSHGIFNRLAYCVWFDGKCLSASGCTRTKENAAQINDVSRLTACPPVVQLKGSAFKNNKMLLLKQG